MTKRVMVQMPISQGMREVFDARPDIECDRVTDLSEENLIQQIAHYDAAILGIAPFTSHKQEPRNPYKNSMHRFLPSQ
jgi:hypothetical protein